MKAWIGTVEAVAKSRPVWGALVSVVALLPWLIVTSGPAMAADAYKAVVDRGPNLER